MKIEFLHKGDLYTVDVEEVLRCDSCKLYPKTEAEIAAEARLKECHQSGMCDQPGYTGYCGCRGTGSWSE